MSTRRPRGPLLVDSPTGILLMTYGSAATAEEVPAYLRSVRGGRDADPELVAEFQRRYRLIGWSPLVRITLEQGAELQRLLGIVLSPQWSPVIMGGYRRALDAAAWRLGGDAEVVMAGPWHRTPAFLDALTERVTEATGRLDPGVPVLFCAHSLPKAVVDRDPGYLDQIAETIDAVVERTGLDRARWQFAYQSAGHSPEEWLKPDLKDLLPGLRAEGHTSVLVVPVQFLADHLEILYDIDVAARGEAEEAGLAFFRIELLNTSPAFIGALADVARTEDRSARATA